MRINLYSIKDSVLGLHCTHDGTRCCIVLKRKLRNLMTNLNVQAEELRLHNFSITFSPFVRLLAPFRPHSNQNSTTDPSWNLYLDKSTPPYYLFFFLLLVSCFNWSVKFANYDEVLCCTIFTLIPFFVPKKEYRILMCWTMVEHSC